METSESLSRECKGKSEASEGWEEARSDERRGLGGRDGRGPTEKGVKGDLGEGVIGGEGEVRGALGADWFQR